MPQALAEVWSKMTRAREHYDAVREDLHAFLGGRPKLADLVVNDESEQMREYVQKFAGRKVPLRLRIVAGECIHQLRTALDHVVYRLVLHCGGTPNGKNGFPIYKESPKNAREQRPFDRAIDGVSPAVRDFIVQRQPWQNRTPADDLLAVLQDFDNVNKHQTIVLGVAHPVPMQVVFFPDGFESVALDDGGQWTLESAGVGVERRLEPTIAFPRFGAQSMVPVDRGLLALSAHVAKILRDVDAQFFLPDTK